MQIIISALHFPWRDISDCLAVAREELRLDGVELSLHESFQHPHSTRQELLLLPTLLSNGETTVDAHIWEDLPQLGVTVGTARLQEWVTLCGQVGITGIILHGGSHPEQRVGLGIMRAILENVLGQAESLHVELKLENHYPYNYHDAHELFSEAWEFTELFAALDSPSLQACFDTGHAHMGRDWRPLLDAMGTRLSHIHLADNDGMG